ncbi:MAG: triose-phosphate isomerase [Candidatus Dasytiphilus stammeri]
MRNLLIIANWKLNGNKKIIQDYIKILRPKLMKIDIHKKYCDVVIAFPIMYSDQANQALIDTYISLAAQNVDINLNGPFTGDISANMLKDIGIKYVIIGHSERRIYHQEKDDLIAKKFAIVKKVGLIPVFCIGENNNYKNKEVCIGQIRTVLDTQGVDAFKNTVIAYEPMWAIGSGHCLSPPHTQYIHKFIRDYIATINVSIAENLIILYGGSVNDENAYKFLMQPDIDGLLIGKASLNVMSFYNIIKCALKYKNNQNSNIN